MRKATGTEDVARWSSRRDAGWALQHSAPMQKHLVGLTGLDKGTVSRMCSGERSSDISRFYDFVHDLVVHGKADAGDAIAGAILTAEEAAVTLGEAECRRRALHHLAQEELFEGQENADARTLAYALGADSPDLRQCCERWSNSTRAELGSAMNALIYVRAFMRTRGWRAEP